MVLLFDIGNTNIEVGLADLNGIRETFRLNTFENKSPDEYYLLIKSFVNCKEVKYSIISSVVPNITEKLTTMVQKYFHIEPKIVGYNLKTGIKIKTTNPKEVGSDLICDCAGAVSLYGNEDILIIDLGTANKYIYVHDKSFCGVAISPGVKIAIGSLVNHTALLPSIEIKVPEHVIGTNTIYSMQSGVTYGVAGEVDGMIERIKREVKNENIKIIATGGLSNLIVPLCYNSIQIDPELNMKGLYQIFLKNLEE